MSNVTTLLLNDAFKRATPWTNGVINEMLRQFAPISDISQGRVATYFRCGGTICKLSPDYDSEKTSKIG